MNPASIETDDEPPSPEPADPVERVCGAVLVRESRLSETTLSVADVAPDKSSPGIRHRSVNARMWSTWL